MTSYTWNGVSGDWNDASNWIPAGGPPTASDEATINGTATDTITVDTVDVADSLTLSDANATLNDDGASASLTIGGTLTMSNGTLNISPNGDGGSLTVGALSLSGGALNIDSSGQLDLHGTLSQTGGTLTLNGGTISGGTIDSTAGTLNLDKGTLSGVTFDGPLNVRGSVNLANGTTVVGSSGSGPGTINVTDEEAHLYFDSTQTLSNTTINLGDTSDSFPFDEIVASDTGVNQVLTLASSVTIIAQSYAAITSSNDSGDGIVNEGVIHVNHTLYGFYIEPNAFTNSGTIDVEDGGEAIIDPSTFTTTASSVIEIGILSSLTIDPTNTWSNLGSITLGSGAKLTLDGSISATSVGLVTNSGGTVYVAGTWNNSGQTLNGSAAFGELTLDGGTISGGIVTLAGIAFTTTGGTLSGVTFDGPLNLTTSYASVQLADGTRVVGSSGTGPGTINDTGDGSSLYFHNTQTVSNVTINLGNTSGYYASLNEENERPGARDQVLTLAATVSVDVSGYAYIQSSGYRGDGIVNDGAIDVAGSGGDLIIDPTTFTNNGAIDVANGDSVTIVPTVTGTGTDTISGDSTLEFEGRVSTAKTRGHQDIDFSGGGTLDLLAPDRFFGEISDFAAGDTVELKGSWAFSSISEASGVTTLTLARGSTTHHFEFVGNYAEGNFSITPGTTTKIGFT